MFLRESAPIVADVAAILTAVAVAPTAPAAAAAPTASALPMAFVPLPLSAVAPLPALTLFGSPRLVSLRSLLR